MFTALDFFAGSGLVQLGLEPEFETLWANDNCAKKQAVYVANHPRHKFHLADIQDVRGRDLPSADLGLGIVPLPRPWLNTVLKTTVLKYCRHEA